MAIPELEEIERIPRAGKIHLGVKKLSKGGKEIPSAVDYFVWPEEYAGVLTELFGEKAREIPIMLPLNDKERVAPTFFKRYGAGSSRPYCKGDGISAVRVVMATDPETGKPVPTGELEEIECPGRDCEHYQSKSCRHVMCLQVIIPQLVSEGVFQIDTSSFHSIVNFNSSWRYISSLTHGQVALIPLLLRVVPKEVSPDGRKKVVHVLELKLARRMGLGELQQLAASQVQPLALPGPDEGDAKTYFYPDVTCEEEAAEGEVVELAEDLAGDLETRPDQLDSDIADMQAALGYTKAQMDLRWRKVGGDKQAMLELLAADYEGNGKKQPAPTASKHGESEPGLAEEPAKASAVPSAKQGGFLI